MSIGRYIYKEDFDSSLHMNTQHNSYFDNFYMIMKKKLYQNYFIDNQNQFIQLVHRND
jgi:hypothetical protein